MLSRTLKMAFWVTYDHAGKLILADLATVTAAAVPIAAAVYFLSFFETRYAFIEAVFLAALIFIVALTALAILAASVSALIDHRPSKDLKLIHYMRTALWHVVMVGPLLFAAAVVFLSCAWFYPTHWGRSMPWLGYPLGAVALWAFLMGIVGLHLLVPAFTYPHRAFWWPVRISVLLTLENPGFALGIACTALLGLVICALLGPLLLFYPLFWAALTSAGYELMSRKYESGDDDAPGIDDENDEYLNRGLQDFLFPWKG